MSKYASPTWPLSADWGIGSDNYNWILYQKRGKRWTANGFYPSVESLLQSLYNKVTRTEPADPDLVRHLEGVSERLEACATKLSAQLDAEVMLREKRLSPREGT